MTDAELRQDTATPMPAAELLGIELVQDGPDEVVCRLRIDDRHLNEQLNTHGGVLFTLADTALGLLVNRPDPDRSWVGTSFATQLVRGAVVGDVVLATARREHRSRNLQTVRTVLERERDGALLGSVGGQMLASPPPRPPEAGDAVVTLRRAGATDPLLRAMVAALRREDPAASWPDVAVLGVLWVGRQPCGFAETCPDGRTGRSWIHPRWRGQELSVPEVSSPAREEPGEA